MTPQQQPKEGDRIVHRHGGYSAIVSRVRDGIFDILIPLNGRTIAIDETLSKFDKFWRIEGCAK